MPVLVICKFDIDLIENEQAMLEIRLFQPSRASNSKLNCTIRPKFKVIQDFVSILVICMFDEDPMKTEQIRLEKSICPIIPLGTLGKISV